MKETNIMKYFNLSSLIYEHGFYDFSVLKADKDEQDKKMEDHYYEFIEKNRELEYLISHAPMKYNPKNIISNCKSLIMLIYPYYQKKKRDNIIKENEANISVYALGRDYHKVIKKKIKSIIRTLKSEFKNEDFRGFVDTSPLDEVYYAKKSGLGFIGRNQLLITRKGSFFFIADILSSYDFTKDYIKKEIKEKCPSNCRKCIDICPNKALIFNKKTQETDFKLSNCISYLNIEKKELLNEEEYSKLSNWLFGCDLCQDVCPFNIISRETHEKNFLNKKIEQRVNLADILKMTKEEFDSKFSGSPIKKNRVGIIYK